MELQSLDPIRKQMIDDAFDAFSMIAKGALVAVMDVKTLVRRIAPGAAELLGYEGEYAFDKEFDWNGCIHPEDRRRYRNAVMPLLEGRAQTFDVTFRVHTLNGGYGNFRSVGAVLRGSDGRPALIADVLLNEGMDSNIDSVTILPNRAGFMEDLSRRMKGRREFVCLLAGITGLSEINRVHGYSYGNRLLQEIAWLLQEIVRDRCEAYRMDGSTFALLANGLSKSEVSAIYDMIRYRLQRGIEVNGMRNILRANGGMVSSYGMDADPASVLSCLKYAYAESKENHHGELVDFNGSRYYGEQESLHLINAIRDSIVDGCRGFGIVYRPFFDAATASIRGCEALISWEDPKYGKVGQEEFLPILEHDFIFEELGEFMICEGLKEGARFLQAFPGFRLCLNVYRIQLDLDYFLEDLFEAVEEAGFPPELLSIKFDKECQYIDTDRAREIACRLSERGIRCVIDGFGVGRDSLTFFKKVPVSAVAVDGSFVTGIEENRRDRDILEHMVRMASACVPYINVRDVENEAQLEILRGMPVTTVQGSLFAGLLSFDEMTESYFS